MMQAIELNHKFDKNTESVKSVTLAVFMRSSIRVVSLSSISKTITSLFFSNQITTFKLV